MDSGSSSSPSQGLELLRLYFCGVCFQTRFLNILAVSDKIFFITEPRVLDNSTYLGPNRAGIFSHYLHLKNEV
jgi:hypothetical protein